MIKKSKFKPCCDTLAYYLGDDNGPVLFEVDGNQVLARIQSEDGEFYSITMRHCPICGTKLDKIQES